MATTTLWSRVLSDPQLQDLPYKIETHEGKITLSPHKPKHSRLQTRILKLMDQHILARGEAYVEYAVATRKGIKVPDVVWFSVERLDELPDEMEASPVAPDICAEVLSGANTAREMAEKRQLYFEAGAIEVWICSESGEMLFYHVGEEHASTHSRLAPSFPALVR